MFEVPLVVFELLEEWEELQGWGGGGLHCLLEGLCGVAEDLEVGALGRFVGCPGMCLDPIGEGAHLAGDSQGLVHLVGKWGLGGGILVIGHRFGVLDFSWLKLRCPPPFEALV